jgi:hypothetical protein
MIELFILLLMMHALCDFPLQTEAMAKGKNRNRKIDLSQVPKGQKIVTVWPYYMSAHALIHGLGVYVITGMIWLGIAEVIAHWVIDFGKCENWTNPHQDQVFHIVTKGLWTVLA